MRVTDLASELPESLIVHYPIPERSSRRLFSLDGPTGALTYGTLTDILDKLDPGNLLVSNNTRMIPAYLFGRKASGGKIKMLVERILDDKRILAHIRASGTPKPGAELLLGDDENIRATMLAHHDVLFEVEFDGEHSVLEILSGIGHIPLLPYIDRPDGDANHELYQTVYGARPGTIAAPTAGLHFDEPLLGKLRAKDVKMMFITLHVRTETFQSVHIDNIKEHAMCSEYTEMPQEVVDTVLAAKARGNRVIAVGTTSVRLLKSAAQTTKDALIVPFFDDTQIFIYPGYQYQVTDALVTSFHLPESTLVMLMPTPVGYRHAMSAYKVAVEQKYRFFSYGDTIFTTCSPQAISERP